MELELIKNFNVKISVFSEETNGIYIFPSFDGEEGFEETISAKDYENLTPTEKLFYESWDEEYYFFSLDKYLNEIGSFDCTISYPLDNPCNFKIEKRDEEYLCIENIIHQICEKYRQIYKEEDESLSEVSESEDLLNRGESDGKWGIWGHDLEDLILEGITLIPEEKRIEIFVGS